MTQDHLEALQVDPFRLPLNARGVSDGVSSLSFLTADGHVPDLHVAAADLHRQKRHWGARQRARSD